MEENIFFKNETVTISQNQFIVENQTFALDNVTSIKIETSPPSRRVSGNTAIIGALCLSLDELFFMLGFVLLAVAGYLWKIGKPKHSIILNTSAGEKQTLVSDDEEYIKQVFAALNAALESRES